MSPEDQAVSAVEERFRIGELARRVGATPRTVRYYEELGLLPARGRPEGAHRLYDAEDEMRLAELIRVRDLLGLSLAELRDWMDAEAARAVLRERWHGRPAPAVGDRARILAEAMRPRRDPGRPGALAARWRSSSSRTSCSTSAGGSRTLRDEFEEQV